MADVFPPDPLSPVGQIRFLIADTEQFDYDSNGTPRYRLTDPQLEAFSAMAGEGRLYAAGANALRALAANEILIGKVIRTEDLQTDGAKVGDALRLLARELDTRQGREDDDNAYAANAFEIVDFSYPYTNMEP